MKKIIALILTTIFCLTAFCGCVSNKNFAPDGMKVLESSDKLDYNIYIPASWIQDLSTGVVSAYYSASDLSNISMTQFNLETLDTLQNYVDKYVKDLEENLKDFKLAEGFPKKTLLDKVEAYKLEYTATLAGNEYKYMQFICINRATIYYFTYTAMVDAYDSHTEDVQKIIDNFSFKKS